MANSDTKELESQAAVDGALFRQLVADGYDQCAEAYLKTHAAHDPDDMRAEPFAQLLATLSEGAHVLDAGCGAGVPIAKAVVDDPRQMRVTGVDISKRQIELANGMEERPCITCVSFEKDTNRLIRHLLRHKLIADENGIFTTPIAKDFPGRVSMRIDPRTTGFCRRDTIVVDMLATCSAYRCVRTASEFESRIRE